ncbi:MAG: aminotransferase class V-fold PLP-dependent enzyme [Candidatus Gracilibacteria bacterium]
MKSDFPIFSNRPLVYLDSAATTQKPQYVIDKVAEYLTTSNANIHRGGYAISDESAELYLNSKKSYQELVHAGKEYSTVYSANATHAINEIALMIERSVKVQSGDQIIIQRDNHHANIVPWMILAQKTGATIVWLDTHNISSGNIIKQLQQITTEHTKIIALTLVTNVTGAIYPWKNLGSTLGNKIYTVVDASQALPHHLLDIESLNASFAVATAHKYYALTGLGMYTAKTDLLRELTPGIGGGGAINFVREDGFEFAGMPYRHEPGTPNVVAAVSLLAAIEYLRDKKKLIQSKEDELTSYFLSGFEDIQERFELLQSPTGNGVGIFSLVPKIGHIADYSDYLGERHIAVRAGQHCCEPYHTICNISGTLRVSFGIYTTQEDIDTFFRVLKSSYDYV